MRILDFIDTNLPTIRVINVNFLYSDHVTCKLRLICICLSTEEKIQLATM
jgi:hypothetical protein